MHLIPLLIMYFFC